MSGERFVDVTYRGLEVGKRLKLCHFGPRTAYLEAAAPLPVGARLELETDDGQRLPVGVIRVQEQVAGADLPPGMRVSLLGDGAANASDWWSALVEGADPQIPPPPRQPGVPEAPAEPPRGAVEPAAGPKAVEARPAPVEAAPAAPAEAAPAASASDDDAAASDDDAPAKANGDSSKDTKGRKRRRRKRRTSRSRRQA